MTQDAEQETFAAVAEGVFAASHDNAVADPTPLGPRLLAEFAQAEMDRRPTEQRWLRDLRQYRGQYDPEVLALIGKNRSKVFVRKTRVKVKTLDSRMDDLIFPSGSEKNWSVKPTPKPSIPKAKFNEIYAALRDGMQHAAAQQDPASAPMPVVVNQEMIDVAVQSYVSEAAKKMEKTVEDQLIESRYRSACKKAMHSGHLYGTGVIKGPLVERKVRAIYAQNARGEWVSKSQSYVIPFVDYVPLWRLYPDMNATTLEGCRYMYERHLLSRAGLAELAERRTFKSYAKVIKEYILSNPRGAIRPLSIDTELKDIGERQSNQATEDGQYEVLERWGWLTGEELRMCNVRVPDDRIHETFFSNVWLLSNGQIIKSVLQPINGVTWPYHFYYFDEDETTIFPEGMASLMRDDQISLNAASRMILDNGAMTSGPMFEVSPGLLTNTESLDDIRPWRVWIRNANNPGQQAVRTVQLGTSLNELNAIANRFENNTDEVTAIPRYMSGENVSNGAAGTAAGMSMLMGASNIVIKDLVSSWDEGITNPFLEGMYQWNMQFNSDPSIKGDFNVKASGASSLVAKEVRARMLNEFASMTANPMDAPFIKRDVLNRKRAEALDMSDIVKTDEEVKADTNNGQMQMQAQIEQIRLELEKAQAEAKIASMNADVAVKQAQVERMKAETIDKKVEAVFAALQAAGVAVQNGAIAPAGDEILRSSGWVDQTPSEPIGDIEANPQGDIQMAGNPNPATGHLGMRAGMNTASLNG